MPGPETVPLRQRLRQARAETDRDRRNGIDDPFLARLRVDAAYRNDYARVEAYIQRKGYHLHVRPQVSLLARLSAESTIPYRIPAMDIVPTAHSSPSRLWRLGNVGFHGEGLYLDLLSSLLLGIAASGEAGYGKTTLLASIAAGIVQTQADVGCFIFNIRPEYSDTLAGFTKVKLSEVLPNVVEFFPEISARVQAEDAADISAGVNYQLWSRTALKAALLCFYLKGVCPTVRMVRQALLKLPPREYGIDERQKNKLVGIVGDYITSIGKQAAGLQHGFDIAKYWNSRLIIENDLSITTYCIVVTTLINRLYRHNIAAGLREQLRSVFLIDESKHFLPAQREGQVVTFGEPFIYRLLCEQRSAGLAAVAATQTVHPPTYLANTATKIVFKNGEFSFFEHMARSMGLDRDQVRFAQKVLKPMQFVATCNHWPEPLLCVMQRPEVGTETEHIRAMRREDFLSRVASYRQYSTDSPEVATQELAGTIQSMVVEEGIFPDADRLLQHCALNRRTPITEAYKKLGFGSGRGDRAKEHLSNNGLVNAEWVRLHRGSGGMVVLMEPTDKGIDYLVRWRPDLKGKVRRLAGKGSLEHRVHVDLIATAFSNRVQKKEHKEVDLVLQAEDGKSWFAVEVVDKDSRNIEQRVRQNREAGLVGTLVACSKVAMAKKLAKVFRGVGDVKVEDMDRFLLQGKKERERQAHNNDEPKNNKEMQ